MLSQDKYKLDGKYEVNQQGLMDINYTDKYCITISWFYWLNLKQKIFKQSKDLYQWILMALISVKNPIG